MKKIWLAICVVMAGIIFQSCATPMVVTERMTPPAYIRPVAPGPGYVWIDGDWIITGGNYRWREGYWSAPGRRNWQGGHWAPRRQGYYWRRGHWR